MGEKTVFQFAQTIGTTKNQLPSKMQPIQQSLLLVDVEAVGIKIIPDHIGDRSPLQRIGRQRNRIFRFIGNDKIKLGHLVGRIRLGIVDRNRIGQVEVLHFLLATGQQNHVILKPLHQSINAHWRSEHRRAATSRQQIKLHVGQASICVWGQPRRRLEVLPLPLGQRKRPRGGERKLRTRNFSRLS